MKNYWIEARKNRRPRMIFELIGYLSAVEVEVVANGLPGLCVQSSDPKFVSFVTNAAKLLGTDGYLSVVANGNLEEGWPLHSVKNLEYNIVANGNKKVGRFRFDCGNASRVKSRFFKMN